jgi:murein L,D-transpeptidase YcbB/YkuD
MNTRPRQARGLLLLCGLLLCLPVHADGVSRALLDIHERLYVEGAGASIFPGTTVYEPALVSAFYESRDYRPAWIDADYAREMLQLLQSSADEGLDPSDYHYPELLALQEQYRREWSDNNALRAQAEVLLTDGLLLYARHLIQGKVDPTTLDTTWNYTRRELDPEEVAAALASAISERRVATVLDGLKPGFGFYGIMKEQLAHYRELARDDGFSPLPTDVVLHPGDQHETVAALRRRLQQMAYLPQAVQASDLFDEPVELAVQALQRDNGLAVDGVVGRQTFEVLNLSPAEKIDRIRINLDRLRWINDTTSDDFIVVNIAGFELYYLRNLETVWETPVMVGKIQTRTPIFHERLSYLEFNPTWNAPRSLVRGLVPKFKADPAFATEKGYRFYDAAGQEVSAASIDWPAQSPRSFPYRVVQMPGPANAMGQVKFMFPNQHAIYLHDTPSRELFSRSQRAFSAGCIRVKNPLELARVLLDDPDNWSARQIQALVDSGRPREVVRMQRDVDVLLMYWTVSPSADGRLQFHSDIYQLDPPALAALDATPRPDSLAQN